MKDSALWSLMNIDNMERYYNILIFNVLFKKIWLWWSLFRAERKSSVYLNISFTKRTRYRTIMNIYNWKYRKELISCLHWSHVYHCSNLFGQISIYCLYTSHSSLIGEIFGVWFKILVNLFLLAQNPSTHSHCLQQKYLFFCRQYFEPCKTFRNTMCFTVNSC